MKKLGLIVVVALIGYGYFHMANEEKELSTVGVAKPSQPRQMRAHQDGHDYDHESVSHEWAANDEQSQNDYLNDTVASNESKEIEISLAAKEAEDLDLRFRSEGRTQADHKEHEKRLADTYAQEGMELVYLAK